MKAILVCDYDDYGTYEALFEALEKNGIKYKIIKDYDLD